MKMGYCISVPVVLSCELCEAAETVHVPLFQQTAVIGITWRTDWGGEPQMDVEEQEMMTVSRQDMYDEIGNARWVYEWSVLKCPTCAGKT